MKLTHTLLAFILCFSVTNGQTKKEKRAAIKFDGYQYAEAIDVYERLINLGYNSETIYRKLANSNYLNARYENAASWYEKLMQLENATIEPEEIYKYALTLKSIGKYKESDAWMRKFDASKNYDSRASLFEQNTDYLKAIQENSGRYTLKNLEINSKVSEFSPAYYNNNLVFSSSRDTGTVRNNIHEWNNQPFLNLYVATTAENGTPINPTKLDRKLNKKTHESSAVFTKDGNTMYFTRNNSNNGRFSRGKDGVSRLKIYRATKIDNQWKKITELPFNSDDYSIAHPALSPDETKLYFASDMPGTRGMSDLYMAEISADGSFGPPTNLGNNINTEARETFPFVTKNNILYFASDGHPGLGGLDIFATQISDTFTASNILNIGEPINSKNDDFSLIFNEDTQTGFFASNRDEGKGLDDIYSFTQTKELPFNCDNTFTGTVIDEKTGASIAHARLQLKDKDNALLLEMISDDKGNFKLLDMCWEDAYTLTAEKTDYLSEDTSFTSSLGAQDNPIVVKLMPIQKIATTGTDLAKHLKLDPIYFDSDKSVIKKEAHPILDKVVDYMKKYPNTFIQVRSHTDSQGKESYNLQLSNRRALSTMKYLIQKGIAPTRLSSKGFGETNPLLKCENGTKCPKETHQKNRRSEFIVME